MFRSRIPFRGIYGTVFFLYTLQCCLVPPLYLVSLPSCQGPQRMKEGKEKLRKGGREKLRKREEKEEKMKVMKDKDKDSIWS